MGSQFGVNGLIQIILSLFCIGIAWWSLQALRWDAFLVKPNSPQAKVFVIILSIVLGAGVAEFFSNYFAWSSMLQFLF